MRRQVLAPDRDERVVVDPVAVVRPQRRAPGRGIKVGRVGAIVDEEELAVHERRHGRGDPGVEREADLGRLPGLEGDVLRGEARFDRPGRGRPKDGVELASRSEGHVSLEDGAMGIVGRCALDPVDRERVEELVGEDDSLRRVIVGRLEIAHQPGRVEASGKPGHGRSRDLDRLVRDRAEQRRA